jgi:ankyrin repeat protein
MDLDQLLIQACVDGRKYDVVYLLDNGADVNAFDKLGYAGYSPLVTAARFGHTDIVKILLEHGSEDTNRAIVIAGRYGHDEIVKILTQ